ncbi:tRNA (adenosine(37)-N6)-dimethylallyltransferase MiaA, partial [Patescibacteria group bacterium]|nr:tRNA (adenosine(37)-N6)-dimethylallyltransferase MiaA [Patescibacteria group bacterium]
MKNKVYIICGPTSSGKTSLALDLCKKYGGEIVSADSRQICKGIDIG